MKLSRLVVVASFALVPLLAATSLSGGPSGTRLILF